MGMRPGEAFVFVQKDGYPRTRVHLYRQIRLVDSHGVTSARVKRAGRKPLLNPTQMEQIWDFVTTKNTNERPVERRHVQTFIRQTLGITGPTTGNVLARLNMSKKVCQERTSPCKLTKGERVKIYYKFILKLREDNVLNDPSAIASMDVCTDSKGGFKKWGFSPINSGPIKITKVPKPYTSAIVTMVWGDGIDRTPSKLYTHDPFFNPTPGLTPAKKMKREALTAMLTKLEIDEKRIVYIPRERSKYCGENPGIYEDFLDSYDIPKNTLILHDNGPAYKRKKVHILDARGFPNHRAYPSAVHQWLSPNDNNVHGCKSKWHAEREDFSNDQERVLRLMQLIALETKERSKKYFRRNIFAVKRSNIPSVMSS